MMYGFGVIYIPFSCCHEACACISLSPFCHDFTFSMDLTFYPSGSYSISYFLTFSHVMHIPVILCKNADTTLLGHICLGLEGKVSSSIAMPQLTGVNIRRG